MRWLINVSKALAVLLLAGAVLAFLLPEHRVVSRSRDIELPIERIWPLLAQTRRWVEWSPWFAKDPGMKLSYSGPDSGPGAAWHWESSTQGKGNMQFERVEPRRLIAYRLTFDDMASTAVGELRLVPISAAVTRVEWTFETHLGHNPLLRWFGIGLDTMVGKDFDAGLARLAQAARS